MDSRTKLCILITCIVFLYIVWNIPREFDTPEQGPISVRFGKSKATYKDQSSIEKMSSLPRLDFTKLDSPPALEVDDAKFSHSSLKVKVDFPDAKVSLDIHTEQVVKTGVDPDRSVLFLHGMRFSSKNWIDIQSVFHVANWGWKAVAVDLPGFGQSTDKLNPKHNGEFLVALISKLGLKKPVVVSPSMSGSFSLPFLFGDGVNGLDRALGYVPVAPARTGSFVKNYKKGLLPTLIVYGTKDVSLGKTSAKDLGHLPQGQLAPIEGAGHACYLDNPDAFHKYLYFFLNRL